MSRGRRLSPCAPRIVQKLVVARDMGTGKDFRAAIFCQGRRGKELSDGAEPANDRSAIGLLAQIARIDRRRFSGITGFGLDVTARQRAHLPSPGGDAREIVEFADLAILEAARRNAALDVWCRRFLQNADSSSTLTDAAAKEAL